MKKHDETLFQIGEVTKILGVTRKTLLVFEDMDLLVPAVKDEESGDLTVRKTTLPRQVCFCRRHICENVSEASDRLRDTYISAARTGKMAMLGRMFTMRMSPTSEVLDLMCCIPVEDNFDGPERVEFAETPALCIYYRGPYEGTVTAMRTLAAYIKENNIETTGPFRSIYMEGPPNRGNHSEDYITQVAVPIKV